MLNRAPSPIRLNRYRVLAVAVVALILFSSLPVQQASAQTPYTEKLSVYIAGSDALWFFTFGGVNGSSHLSALESTPGLSWYNVSAVSAANWGSDFQLFGPRGYNLLHLPFLPSQGMFLTVGSDSYSDASAAAAALDSYLLTDFVSLSNGTSTYSFYSPVSFNTLVPVTLLRLLPTSEGGFASVLTASSFTSTSSPFVVLEGNKTSSGFSHSLVVGSITDAALSSTGAPEILSYFGSTVASLRASNMSSSSTVQIQAMDGVISSTDSATVTNNYRAFTGSYALSIGAGKAVSQINATVVEQTAPLLATRAVDVGVLHTNGDVAVTLTFKDLSPSDTITNVTYTDNWWNSSGDFKFLGGSDNVSSTSLSPGGTVTPVYRLEYVGNTTGSTVIPASVVSYTYQADGATFNATTTLNPIRLSLGADDAVVYATLTPSGSLGVPVGESEGMNVTLVNVGTLPASSVVVQGKTVAGLAAGGGTATVTLQQTASGLTGVNDTQDYSVSYQNPSGQSLNATTNVVSDVFSQSSMQIGFPTLTAGVSLTPLAGSATNLTLTFAVSDLAPHNVTSFSANTTLPADLGCGSLSGTGISCSGGNLSLSYAVINSSSTVRSSVSYNITKGDNFILPPIAFTAGGAKANLSGMSNAVAVPAGVKVTKQFAPSELFGGMTSLVSVQAANEGTTPIYNATVSSTIDSFDLLSNASSLSQAAASVGPNSTVSFAYRVSMSQTYGSLSGTTASASFYYGGTPFTVKGAAPTADIYAPLSVSIRTSPTVPEEGKTFTITIVITNPSAVPVSNVNFTLPLPAGLSLSSLENAQVASKVLSVIDSSLAPGASVNASAQGVAGSGITIPFAKATLTFAYGGVTISGVVPTTSGIGISENVLTRYVVPTGFILIAALAVSFYLRRKAATVPSSQK
jgi:large repetitive protein